MKDYYNKLLFHLSMSKIYADEIYKKLQDNKQYVEANKFKVVRDGINTETFNKYLNNL